MHSLKRDSIHRSLDSVYLNPSIDKKIEDHINYKLKLKLNLTHAQTIQATTAGLTRFFTYFEKNTFKYAFVC